MFYPRAFQTKTLKR